MVVFLASWSMVFVGLLFAHLLLGATPSVIDAELPAGLAGASTAVLVVAAFIGHTGRGKSGARIAAILGMLFLALQVLLWRELWQRGFWPQDSKEASSLYALIGFHFIHAAVGVMGLFWASRSLGPRLRFWSWYWDFVGVVWVVVFLVGFVL